MARMGEEHQSAQPPARIAGYRRVLIVDLTPKDLLTAEKRAHDFELRRNHDKIRVAPDLELAFCRETNLMGRRIRGHGDSFVQWNIDLRDHGTDKIDHARRTAGERRAIGEQTN